MGARLRRCSALYAALLGDTTVLQNRKGTCTFICTDDADHPFSQFEHSSVYELSSEGIPSSRAHGNLFAGRVDCSDFGSAGNFSDFR